MAAQIEASRVPFIFLTGLAVIFMQGFFMLDGGFFGIIIGILKGYFPDGVNKFPHIYTGLPLIDQLLTIPVVFFFPMLRDYPPSQVQNMMLCAAIQPFGVWLTIESCRKGQKHALLRWAPVTLFVSLFLGIAMFFPYYCFVELNRHFNRSSASDPSIPYISAAAILPSVLLGGIHPYRLLFFPPSGTTDELYAAYIAWYHLGCFITYFSIIGITYLWSPADGIEKRRAAHADAWWVKANYAFIGAFSAIIHISVMLKLARSADANVTFDTVFIPRFSNLWTTDAHTLNYVRETLFFLQWDFIVFVLACAYWMTRTTEGMYAGSEAGWGSVISALLILAFSVSSTLLGPGAVVSVVLYFREDTLRKAWVERKTVESEGEKEHLLGGH